MPPRSKVLQLPDEVKSQLDRRLVDQGFADYEALSAWLSEQGFEISKSAVHRYGTAFERRLAQLRLATEQARAVVEASPDEAGATNEALIRLMQERLFGVLLDLDVEDIDEKKIAALTRSVADLARASVTQKRYEQQVRDRAVAAADAVEEVARGGGLTDGTIEVIKKQILGIA